MTETEAETCQQWRGMDGVTAFHLIERHADGWEDIDMMMGAWHRANTEDDKADADAEIRRLRAALIELEDANDALCALRTREQYLSMIDGGQRGALQRLDEARRVARTLVPPNVEHNRRPQGVRIDGPVGPHTQEK